LQGPDALLALAMNQWRRRPQTPKLHSDTKTWKFLGWLLKFKIHTQCCVNSRHDYYTSKENSREWF